MAAPGWDAPVVVGTGAPRKLKVSDLGMIQWLLSHALGDIGTHESHELLPVTPLILPLGDHGLLLRFSESLSDDANRRALGFASRAGSAALSGVDEVVSNLVSVLVRYDPAKVSFERLAGELRLLLALTDVVPQVGNVATIEVSFDGEDLAEVATMVGLSPLAFVEAHNAQPLRALSTGFAPGFLYTGFHPPALEVPRRTTVRRQVPAGTVLFAAGQTAVTSTPIPTGWHVIGHTSFRNFDALATQPVTIGAGDLVRFETAP